MQNQLSCHTAPDIEVAMREFLTDAAGAQHCVHGLLAANSKQRCRQTPTSKHVNSSAELEHTLG